MQDIAGKLFNDRSLRPQNHRRHHHHHHQQSLKCPRCDSLNTKFCYYNNYNLSQPRHFCKNCRRYWTNGGILRNVPVGGGCRKSKPKPKPKPNPNPTYIPAPPPKSESSGGGGGDNNNNATQQHVVFEVGSSTTETVSFGELYDDLALDWVHSNPTAENGDDGLIDLIRTVDHHEVYWSQATTSVEDYSNHWSHVISSHPLFLP
ncbi:hypothetical protein vseg_013767 [Gypsophila vaccaria]